MNAEELERQLLVKAALEAVLEKAQNRFDPKERDQRLKAATLLECADVGYANLTIAAIAKRSRVSTATIYAMYKDREALLVASVEMLLSILENDVIEAPPVDDPIERVQLLLFAHGLVYAQPFATWLFRLYINLAWFGHDSLRLYGARVFAKIDAFWENLLNDLVERGDLVAVDVRALVPMLLGPIERWTILSRLSWGEQARPEAELAEIARYGAHTLFAIWGKNTRPLDHSRVLSASNISASVKAQSVLADSMAHDLAFEVTPELTRWRTALDAFHASEELTDARSAAIRRAAIEEAKAQGYNTANVAHVAAHAGVSLATLYKSFGDKAGLYTDIMQRETRAALGAQTGPYTQAPLAPSHEAMAHALYLQAKATTLPEKAWVLHLASVSELSPTPAVVACNRACRDRLEARWRQCLENLNAALAENDADAAIAVNFMLGGIERLSVFTYLLFGEDAINDVQLQAQADLIAAVGLALFGSDDDGVPGNALAMCEVQT